MNFLSRKLGLTKQREGDDELARDLFSLMADHETDFTLTFRRLTDLAQPTEAQAETVESQFEFPEAFDAWLQRWQLRIKSDTNSGRVGQIQMAIANPAFIPRNHRVEEVIAAAVSDNDLAPVHQLVDVVSDPYTYNPRYSGFAIPPRAEEIVAQTFCGT